MVIQVAAMAVGAIVGSILKKRKKKKLNKKMAREGGIQSASQREVERLEQLKANFGTKLEKVQQLREGRIRRAQVIASGVNSGVGVGSSATQGGAQAAFSTAIGNSSALNVYQAYSEAASQARQKAAEAGAKQEVIGAKITTAEDQGNLVGSAVGTGLGLATLRWGGVAGAVTTAAGGNNLTGVNK